MLEDPSGSPHTPCKVCAAPAPTKYVDFYQNIGMVVTRQWSHIDGNLCRRCIRVYFRSYTLTTLFLGWWGVVSFLVTPFILLNNVARYMFSLNLPEPGIAALNTPLLSTSPINVSTHSRKFKLIYGVIVCIGVLAFAAYKSVDFMEKHAPRINAALHDGEISDESDGEYAGIKVGKDIAALATPVKGDDWAAIRSDFLSREPYFRDLKLQNERFQERIVVEKNANLGDNDICERIALSEFGPALKDYTDVLAAEFSVLKTAPQPSPDAVASIGALGKQETAALKRLSVYFDDTKTNGCDK